VPRLIAPLAIPGAVALAYFNALSGPFQFDDWNVIVHNPAVTAWLPDVGGLRPLLKLSYALNWRIDPAPFGFHLFNGVLHALNALLVYALGARLAAPVLDAAAARRAALIGALLFALHPVHTEAVTYISGRSAALMTFFYLASLLAWVHGRARNSRAWLWGVSPLLFGLALLTRETAVTLPFALLLWEACCRREGGALRAQWPHWLVLAAAILAMALHPGYRELLAWAPNMDTLRTQVHGVTYLMSRWIMLAGLNLDPDLRLQTVWSAILVAQAVALALLLAAGLWALRRRPWLGFGVLWLFLQLLPGNSLILRWDVANERQLYLAGVGVWLALGLELENLRARLPRPVAAPALALLLAGLAAFTMLRNDDYRSEVALWEDAARKSPHKARVHNNLGDAYRQAGEPAKARASFARALSIDPDYLLARNNLRAVEAEFGAGSSPRR